MKKSFIVIIVLLSLVKGVNAGDKLKLGIKVNPVISFAAVKDKDSKDGFSYNGEGSALRFIVGPYIDYMINDNVFFSFGLWYSPRTIKMSVKTTDALGFSHTGNSQYNLQYLMVPLYFKFYTNEISEGMKLYFTLGGTADFKIAEKNVGDKDEVGLKDLASNEGKQLFSFIDGGLLIGAGVEFKLGTITTLYGGLSYNRGLTNIVNPLISNNGNKPYQHVAIKNNLIGIDLGVKF
ncbi:MAG: PorT family protein [Opitutaceae bacterium]|nr:PorT family protein [Cytophagales bacterium]